MLAALNEIAEQSQRAAAILKTLRRMTQRAEPRREPVDVTEVVWEVENRRARVMRKVQARSIAELVWVRSASGPTDP